MVQLFPLFVVLLRNPLEPARKPVLLIKNSDFKLFVTPILTLFQVVPESVVLNSRPFSPQLKPVTEFRNLMQLSFNEVPDVCCIQLLPLLVVFKIT